jgi:MinD superfamily P-loop ATPase
MTSQHNTCETEGLKELVVISGKGGTGKTSLTASFAALSAQLVVIADCDVDAADLGMLLSPNVEQKHSFISGHQSLIRQDDCIRCGKCHEACRFGGVSRLSLNGSFYYEIDENQCEGCGVCLHVCPVAAVDFQDRKCGYWYESTTRYGPMVHAEMQGMAENSGRLVTIVRQGARQIAAAGKRPLLITDGPPGTGCPVIASITGASLVLIVAEPTRSGEHDMRRIVDLVRFFKIPAAVCVNKWDINPEQCLRIEQIATDNGVYVAGRVSYDSSFTEAQLAGQPVVSFVASHQAELKAGTDNDTMLIADEITQLWRNLARYGALPTQRTRAGVSNG